MRGCNSVVLSVMTDTDGGLRLRVSYNLWYNVRVAEVGKW